MLKRHARSLAVGFRFLDSLLILLLFYLLVTVGVKQTLFSLNETASGYYVLGFLYIIIWLYLSRERRLYRSKRTISFRNEILDVFRTTSLSGLIIAAIYWLIFRKPLDYVVGIYLFVSIPAALIVLRLSIRETLKYIRRRGYNYRQVLLVGQNARAAAIAKRLATNPDFGLRILGYIDAPNGNGHSEEAVDFKQLGRLEDLEKILREQVVDEILIALPMKSFYTEIANIIQISEQVGIEVKIPTDLFTVKLATASMSTYADMDLIDFYTSPKMTWQLLTKRFLDLTLSAILLVMLSPLFVIISIVIKATSVGPVLFKQQRVGYNGRQFLCLKFRTMVQNAEDMKEQLIHLNEVAGPVFKMKNDPRVTRVGRFLRKTSIDELPQLINVFMGDMSLVGPRPPLPSEVREYCLAHRRRLSMKPGLTCIWQTSGRNSLNFQKWVELDEQYIDTWSLWLDFKILLRTVPAILKGSGV